MHPYLELERLNSFDGKMGNQQTGTVRVVGPCVSGCVLVPRQCRPFGHPPREDHRSPRCPLCLRRREIELASPRIMLMNPDCRISLLEQGRLWVLEVNTEGLCAERLRVKINTEALRGS